MRSERTLNQLLPGQQATVCEVRTEGPMRRRFQDMGLIAGTTVECLGVSPWGDPSAYRIRGAVIALRARDCADVVIQS